MSSQNSQYYLLMNLIEQMEGAMTVEELALILICSKKTRYKRMKKGKLPVIKIGSLIRLCPRTVADWFRSHSIGLLNKNMVAYGPSVGQNITHSSSVQRS